LTLLTNLLYTQPLLLSPLLRGLSALVTSTLRLANSATEAVELRKQFGVDQRGAKASLEYLKTLAKDMVAVLLNVFSKLGRDQRGMVGEVIGSWVSIMSAEVSFSNLRPLFALTQSKYQDLIGTYHTVTTHLSTNLSTTTPPSPGASPISHTMLDLLIIFIPHFHQAQREALFKATATEVMLEHEDATVQKKSYRILKRCLEIRSEGVDLGDLVSKLGDVGGGVGPGAQRVSSSESESEWD
jgi:ribosomal RNA-processing protein 12